MSGRPAYARMGAASAGLAGVCAGAWFSSPAAAHGGESYSMSQTLGCISDKLDNIQAALDGDGDGDAKDAVMREELMGLTPLDGRYRGRSRALSQYFSEFSYMKYRTLVEVEYFIELCGLLPELASFPKEKFPVLRDLYRKFDIEDAIKIKKIEHVTNHDVKAIEYFIKETFDAHELFEYKEFIHFALTSQDINNTAMPLAMKAALSEVYLPLMHKFVGELNQKALDWDQYAMLARTHGQPATPTRLGKEMMVFVERLQNQIAMLEAIPATGKFGGATGSLNAHHVAYPHIDWRAVTTKFLARIGLEKQQHTTQIEHYDYLAAQFDALARINTISIDLCRDMWTYVSIGYFTQTIIKNEVGSSAMPHKVNPIDFENAEGNFGVSTAVYTHLSQKLPISRMQRDLTDSTVSRNFGVPLGHALVAIKSMQRGFTKMQVNEKMLHDDLEANWAVVAEAMQTILRREGYPKPYEALKALTRTGGPITHDTIRDFVAGLNVSEEVKVEMWAVTPQNFTGISL